MNIIGLTGSIGMGKSTAAKIFRRLGVPVFDADDCVHQLYKTQARPALERAFPECVGPHGFDRARLAHLIFVNPALREGLEAILHPLVRAALIDWLARQRRRRCLCVVLDVPLLFESGLDALCDYVCVVSAPQHVQKARVLKRKGMTDALFGAVLENQMSDLEKRRRADAVVPSGLGLNTTYRVIYQIFLFMTGRKKCRSFPR